jgi:uncharacterized membrane protein YccC
MTRVDALRESLEKRRCFSSLLAGGWLVHSIRIAVATSSSLLFARLFKMPQPYWAPITTIIVMQSTLGASWGASKWRMIGTAIGACVGGLSATCFETNVLLFGTTLFALGIFCAVLRLDMAAYRFAGVTLAIVTLVANGTTPPLRFAFERFVEVLLGIVVALVFSALWPARDMTAAKT